MKLLTSHCISIVRHMGAKVSQITAIRLIVPQIVQVKNEHQSLSNNRQLDRLFRKLFRLTSQKTLKIHISGPLWENWAVAAGFASRRVNNTESISMSQSHHKRLRCTQITRETARTASICHWSCMILLFILVFHNGSWMKADLWQCKSTLIQRHSSCHHQINDLSRTWPPYALMPPTIHPIRYEDCVVVLCLQGLYYQFILDSHDDVVKWNIFCVTGPLCGEFIGPRWIPRTKACDAELWCFLWSEPE